MSISSVLHDAACLLSDQDFTTSPAPVSLSQCLYRLTGGWTWESTQACTFLGSSIAAEPLNGISYQGYNSQLRAEKMFDALMLASIIGGGPHK